MAPGLDLATTTLLTYAAHSAIACILALTSKRLVRRPQDRDILWKAALIAPLATTAIAVLVHVWAAHPASVDVSLLIRRLVRGELPGRRVIMLMNRGPSGTSVSRTVTDPVAGMVSYVVVSVAALCTLVAVARMLARRIALSRLLRSRQAASHEATKAIFISTSGELHTPVALGAREICLPSEVATSFSEPHRRALIAHETAHLDRRDPTWFVVVDAITALSAFQPLVFAVTRAFRRDVELICDEAAVRHTGDRSALVGALALLASPFDPRSPLNAAASARDGSPLVARAQRIADLTLDGARQRPRVRFMLVAVAATLAMLATAPVLAPLANAGEPPAGLAERRETVRVLKLEGSPDDEEANVYRRVRVIEELDDRR